MGAPITYKGWTIWPSRGYPEPLYSATSPDYDASYEGEEDGWVASGGHVTADSLGELHREIDAWIEEHSDEDS